VVHRISKTRRKWVGQPQSPVLINCAKSWHAVYIIFSIALRLYREATLYWPAAAEK
jgi:hypothetical protein